MRCEVKSQELSYPNPFIIRAHHIDQFKKLVPRYNDKISSHLIVGEDGCIRRIKTLRIDAMHTPEELAKKAVNINSNSDKTYIQDVFGPDLRDIDHVRKQFQEIFERFLLLPQDYPVEITEGAPDHICESCTVGNHCRQSPLETVGQKKSIYKKIKTFFHNLKYPHMDDTMYINKFIEGIKYRNLPKPTITKEYILYTNRQKPKKARRIKTTMGVAKEVISRMEIFDEI